MTEKEKTTNELNGIPTRKFNFPTLLVTEIIFSYTEIIKSYNEKRFSR